MKKIVIAALMLALCMAVAVPALAEGVRDANAAYNELLAGFNGKYPDEYAGAYVDTSDGDKLCVLLTERHADTAAKLGAARDKMLAHISGTYKSSLFGGDSFAGKVEIDCLPVTAGELLNVVFSAEDKGYGALTYRSGESLEFVGYMRMSKTADEVIICLFEDMGDGRKGWSADTGAVISYPDSIENISDKLY